MEKSHTWGIVLAGGEGSRVQTFLAALCGGKGIKQYCAVLGRQSLLETTLARAESLIARERIIVIVDARHRAEAAAQLAHLPAENILYQPANRETAPGILLPLAHILHRDPAAGVAVFPSDHFVVDERRFVASIQKAIAESERFPDQAVLLGMTPDQVEEGYGWIQCAGRAQRGRSRPVANFREKPSRAEAEQLMAQGALWNTFVFAARAEALWGMARLAIADVHREFETFRSMLSSDYAPLFLEQTYRNLRSVNFSSEVLSPMVARLRVLAVPEVGWSDWGSVERILASIRDLGRLHEIAARLKKSAITDPALQTIVANFLGGISSRAPLTGAPRPCARQVHADL
jgi:mannose-1-phosphate guanylyltransferase